MKETKQIPYFNILKFFLAFFVVLGHSFNSYVSDPTIKGIFLFLYAFHMPLFIFLAGFFGKYSRGKVVRFLIFYVILQVIHILLKVFVTTPKEYSSSQIVDLIVEPQWTVWFLLAYAVWILSLKFIKKVKCWHIVLAIVVALAVGFVPFVGKPFTLSRIFYYYPFFLLGKKMRGGDSQDFVCKLKKIQTPLVRIVSLCVFVLALALLITFGGEMKKSFFYGRDPYSSPIELLYRIIALATGAILGFSFMMIVPVNSGDCWQGKFSPQQLGKRSLSIYMFHPIILVFFNKLFDLHSYPTIVIICVFVIVSVALTYISAIKPLHKFINFDIGKFRKNKQ